MSDFKYPGQESYKLYIGGKWVDAGDGATLEAKCPANGAHLATFADATEADVDKAADAALAAFPAWAAMDKFARANILNAVADRIEEHAEELAILADGKIRAVDSAQNIITDESMGRLYDIEVHVERIGSRKVCVPGPLCR